MTNPDLEKEVRTGASAWQNSSYYEAAEKDVAIFWGEKSPFWREFQYLDLSIVVELACGHGRHAAQIAKRVGQLTLLDVHQSNIDAAQARLGNHSNISFHKNNGYDFEPIGDATTTAVYCYDAMVHFQPAVVRAYINDLARILRTNGLALLHHSNYGDSPSEPYYKNPHARNHMTFELFTSFILDTPSLELVRSTPLFWGRPDLDRLSMVRKR